MQVFRWDEVQKEQMNPLLTRQAIHTENMTLSRLELKKGCLVPEHSHVNEQLSTAVTGSMKFVLAGKEVILRAGETLQALRPERGRRRQTAPHRGGGAVLGEQDPGLAQQPRGGQIAGMAVGIEDRVQLPPSAGEPGSGHPPPPVLQACPRGAEP